MLAALVLAAGLAAGCTRDFYRVRADQDAYGLIAQKRAPHWCLEDYSVQPRPDSRMAYPFDPDRPPQPPDDPAAHELMHQVDGKAGWPHWDRNGFTRFVENPGWRSSLHWGPDGVLRVDSDEALRLARTHSRDYQGELEELYLSALDVSFERFRFDAQFFWGEGLLYETAGPIRAGDPAGSSTLELNSDAQVNKLFAAGGELVVGFANSIVWQFAGPDDTGGSSLIDFAFVQPLLRAGGRERVLERLTLAERILLSNVRAMERFRREFYLDIVAGTGTGGGPNRRGGLFGGAGLSGFTGVGGGFGRVGNLGGIGGGGGAGAGNVGGLYGLLQSRLEIENQAENVEALIENLDSQEAFLEESLQTVRAEETPESRRERVLRERLQVEQARQAVVDGKSRLLNARNAYQQELDGYKIDLGLPPDLCVEVEDELLEPFEQLVDPTVREIQRDLRGQLQAITEDARAILDLAETRRNDEGLIVGGRLPWDADLKARLTSLRENIEPAREMLRDTLRERVAAAREDLAELRECAPRRIRELQTLAEQYARNREAICALLPDTDLDPAVFDSTRLEALPDQLTDEIDRVERELREFDAALTKLVNRLATISADGASQTPDALYDALIRDQLVFAASDVLTDARDTLKDLQLTQAQARSECILLTPIEITPEQAFEVARAWRRDLMNARVSLVDIWRLIQFNADDLAADLDIVFSGDIGSVGNDPFDIRASNGRLRAGLEFDAPLTRLAERNNYRQSLIDYQEARRNFYAFEDGILGSLRRILRTLEANRINFEYRRYALRVAAEQIRINDAILEGRLATASAGGATATRDAVSALSDLLNARNDFLSVYVSYEVLRRALDLEMGTMQLTREGDWIDPGPVRGEDFLAGLGRCEELWVEEFPLLIDSDPQDDAPEAVPPPAELLPPIPDAPPGPLPEPAEAPEPLDPPPLPPELREPAGPSLIQPASVEQAIRPQTTRPPKTPAAAPPAPAAPWQHPPRPR